MNKRELLLAVCENPGWQPPQPVASSVERALHELHHEGWIVPRLDGWEATSEAMDAYPTFATQPDIRDPDDPPPGEPRIPVLREGPPRGPDGRPEYERDPCVPVEKDWESEFTLERFVVGQGQQMQSRIAIGNWVNGGVTIGHARPENQRIEVEIVVKTRRVA